MIANTVLYDYHNGLISDEANTGYTRLLETADYLVEDSDSTRTVKNYNYEKFLMRSAFLMEINGMKIIRPTQVISRLEIS